MSESDLGERTEEPTPEKLKRAREEGQFPRSKDGGAVAASAAVLVSLLMLGSQHVGRVEELSRWCFRNPLALVGGGTTHVAQVVFGTLLWIIIPGCVAAAIGGVSVGFLEAGFLPRLELAAPKWERLNPLSQLKALFSPGRGAANVLLSVLRVVAVGGVTLAVLKKHFSLLSRLARAELSVAVRAVLEVALEMAAWSILALAGMAALDYGYSWYRTHRDLMMTRQELKEELHQQEGDPKLKARMRGRAREISKRGLVKEVKRSDVVVANPTHISVALRYRVAEGAPVVTAKGYDEVALYIRKIAEENGIPIVENRPLARALADQVRPGRMIPGDLYQAVAQVLAFVYRFKKQRHLG